MLDGVLGVDHMNLLKVLLLRPPGELWALTTDMLFYQAYTIDCAERGGLWHRDFMSVKP